MKSDIQQDKSLTRGRGITISLLMLCLSFQAMIGGALSLFLPMIQDDLVLSFTQAGTLAASSTLTYALMQIPAGYLGDRFGPKRLFFMGILGTTALLLLFGLSQQYWQALSNESVSGFFRALLFAPGIALITGWFSEERRATAMALHLTGIFSGSLFLSVVGPVLVENFDWRVPFIAFGLGGVIISFVYLRFGKESPRAGPQRKVNISDVLQLFRNRFMWLCGVVQFARMVVLRGVMFWLPTFLIVDRGMSLQVAGLIVALRNMLIGPSSIVGGYVSDKLKNPPAVIGFSFVILAITTALLAVVDNTALLIVIIGINSLFANCYFGPLFSLPLEVLGSHVRGTATGVGNFFANLGGFIFIYLIGALRDAEGSFESGFYATAGAAVFGLVFTILVARARRKAIASTT